MLTKHDERAFDVYLLLLKRAQELRATSIKMNYEEMASNLGISDMLRTDYRRQITKTLRKLEDKYKLITCEFTHGKDAEVKLLPHTKPGGYFNLPCEFWSYGWHRQLSHSAKFVYCVNIQRSEMTKNKTTWSLAGSAMASRYHVSEWVLTKGMHELAGQGIVHIKYSTVINGNYDDRKPNRYELKRLPSPVDMEEQWRSLQEHDAKVVAEARRLAESMDVGRQLQSVRTFVVLIERFGLERVKEATALVAGKRKDNPLRHMGYIIGILEK